MPAILQPANHKNGLEVPRLITVDAKAGSILAKSVQGCSDDQMLIEGWASTKDVDLAGDIVEPTAFTKHFAEYQKAGRYWFNHDQNNVIGKVLKASLHDNGMYIDEAKLTDTPFNRDFIWPHVKDGALSEHSIQFWSYEPKKNTKTGGYIHHNCKMVETSIVSVACNPSAVITGFKSLIPSEDYANASLEELFQLSLTGQLRYPSEIRRNFAVNGTRDWDDASSSNTQEDPQTGNKENQKQMKLNWLPRSEGYDPTGQTLSFKMPGRSTTSYDVVGEKTHLVKSPTGAYMFRIASMTEQGGWKYDFKAIAVSLSHAIQAKSVTPLDDEDRAKAIRELAGLYSIIGKTAPTYKEQSLDDLDDATLLTLKWGEITFHEGEDIEAMAEIAKSNLMQVKSAVAHWVSKQKEVPKDVLALMKDISASIGMHFYVYPEDDSDFAFVKELMDLLQSYKGELEEDDDDYYMYSGADLPAQAKFALFLARKYKLEAKFLEKKKALESESSVTDDEEEEEEDLLLALGIEA